MRQPNDEVGKEYLRDSSDPYFTSSEWRGISVAAFVLVMLAAIALGKPILAIAVSAVAAVALLALR